MIILSRNVVLYYPICISNRNGQVSQMITMQRVFNEICKSCQFKAFTSKSILQEQGIPKQNQVGIYIMKNFKVVLDGYHR